MQEQATVEVAFDCGDKKLERRLEGPTTGLLRRVLEEAGLEGVWTLRDSHRIRRKGRGRFSAIRMENRCGAKSIRIWCKPQGNDTSFEYSLWPPKEADIDSAYRLLSRVHPVTLQISESTLLPGAFFDRVVRVSPMGRSLKPVECVKVREEDQKIDQEVPVPCEVESHASEQKSIESAGAILPLAVDPSWDLWQDEAVDRALVAISFVAEDGYAKKSDASASIIEHLDIKGFCGGASDSYTSVEGSMRSLTMALWKRKRYIERIQSSSRTGKGASDSVKGYMITKKGQKRLEQIKDCFGPEVLGRMNPRWRRSEDGVSHSQVSNAVLPAMWSVSELKEMVAGHDRAERQIAEIDGLVAVLDSELEAIHLELEFLDEEIKRIDEKKRELQEKASEKTLERTEWKKMKRPHEEEKNRLERIMRAKG